MHMEDAAAPPSPAPSTRRSPAAAPTPHPETMTLDISAAHTERPESTTTTARGDGEPPAADEPASIMRILGVNYVPPGAVEFSDGEGAEGDGEGAKEMEEGRSPQRTDVHPLRLDIQPPPPPLPWEAINPPSTNGHGFANSDWHSSQHGSSFHKKVGDAPCRTIPKSSYYFGPPPSDAAYGTDPMGQIGVHHPREIVRVERDYSGGEVVQFAATYPLEFESRITATQFLESINAMNEILISAHSLRYSFVDNLLDILTLRISKLILSSHYDREMGRLRRLMDDLNRDLYNPVGLNILWPRSVGFLFLEIEYY